MNPLPNADAQLREPQRRSAVRAAAQAARERRAAEFDTFFFATHDYPRSVANDKFVGEMFGERNMVAAMGGIPAHNRSFSAADLYPLEQLREQLVSDASWGTSSTALSLGQLAGVISEFSALLLKLILLAPEGIKGASQVKGIVDSLHLDDVYETVRVSLRAGRFDRQALEQKAAQAALLDSLGVQETPLLIELTLAFAAFGEGLLALESLRHDQAELKREVERQLRQLDRAIERQQEGVQRIDAQPSFIMRPLMGWLVPEPPPSKLKQIVENSTAAFDEYLAMANNYRFQREDWLFELDAQAREAAAQ